MEGPSLAPVAARHSAPRARHSSRRGHSFAEQFFFAVTGRDPSVNLDRDLHRVQLGWRIMVFIGVLILREMARGVLRRSN